MSSVIGPVDESIQTTRRDAISKTPKIFLKIRFWPCNTNNVCVCLLTPNDRKLFTSWGDSNLKTKKKPGRLKNRTINKHKFDPVDVSCTEDMEYGLMWMESNRIYAHYCIRYCHHPMVIYEECNAMRRRDKKRSVLNNIWLYNLSLWSPRDSAST